MNYVLLVEAVLCSSIFVIHSFLAFGIIKARIVDRRQFSKALRDVEFAKKGSSKDEIFKVSVIVAAMNEENNLPALLNSLANQRKSDFEVVLVNDRSTDETPLILEQFRSSSDLLVKIIHNKVNPVGCNGKQQALDLGLSLARGNLFLVTDADCIVPPDWVESMERYFSDKNLGAVFGQLKVNSGKSFISRYQAFDQPLVHQYSTGTAGLGIPTSCFGNNLGFRAEVIRTLGGFKALGYTLTEDAALIEATQRLGWRVRVATLPETEVITESQPDWNSFVNQHIRWNSGAFFSKSLLAGGAYKYIVLFLIFSILAIPFSALFSWLLWMPLTSLVSIGMLGLLSVLLYNNNRTKYLLVCKFIPYTMFFMMFYSWVSVLAILGVKTNWKGQRLSRKI